MAHELMIEDGRVSMMYVGEKPWHGLGTQLDHPATAKEAIKAANLEWEIKKIPLIATEGGEEMVVPDRFATVRIDDWGKPDCRILGIVSNQYTPLQNREAFQFFDPIVGEGEAVYHTAGALGNGERIWILAKLPGHITVGEGDITDKYLLLSNSHDGSSAVQIKFTPIRVVCNNTLSMALGNGSALRVPHMSDLHQRLDDARGMLDLIHKRYADIEDGFNRLAKITMKNNRLLEYLTEVFPDPIDANNPQNKKLMKSVLMTRRRAAHFFLEGQGNQQRGVEGTLWAAYNGVTELIDHRGYPWYTPQRRLQSVWFGRGAAIKAKAHRIAMKKAEVWVN